MLSNRVVGVCPRLFEAFCYEIRILATIYLGKAEAIVPRFNLGGHMPTRSARTEWTGTLENGSGQVEMVSSRVGVYSVSFPARAADDANGITSPEELIAAAHSSCYAMQLSALVAQVGGIPKSLDVTAEVSLGPDPSGGFRLDGIKLIVRGEVDGLDGGGFVDAAENAKTSCPVSKALTGVPITLYAAIKV